MSPPIYLQCSNTTYSIIENAVSNNIGSIRVMLNCNISTSGSIHPPDPFI